MTREVKTPIEGLKKETKAIEDTNKMEGMKGAKTSQPEEPLQNVVFQSD